MVAIFGVLLELDRWGGAPKVPTALANDLLHGGVAGPIAVANRDCRHILRLLADDGRLFFPTLWTAVVRQVDSHEPQLRGRDLHVGDDHVPMGAHSVDFHPGVCEDSHCSSGRLRPLCCGRSSSHRTCS